MREKSEWEKERVSKSVCVLYLSVCEINKIKKKKVWIKINDKLAIVVVEDSAGDKQEQQQPQRRSIHQEFVF